MSKSTICVSDGVRKTLHNPPQPLTYLRIGSLVRPHTLNMLSRRIKRLGGLHAEVVTSTEEKPITEHWQ